MANANAAQFGATDGYIISAGVLTGSVNSKLFSLVSWIKRDNTGRGGLMYEAGNDFLVEFEAAGNILVQAENTGSTDILDMVSNINWTDTTNWYCLMISVDLTDVNKRHMYRNDTDILGTVSTYTNDTMDLTEITAIGADTGGNIDLEADIGPFWYNDGQYIDFSVEANRRIFVSSDGKCPSTLANSSDGDISGLGQPLIFLNNPTATYQVNLGSAGDEFTEQGTLAAATGPEISTSSNVIVRRRREMVGLY